MAVVFAEVGQDLHINGDFEAAVNEGVRQGYVEGLLRCSVVADPLRRDRNTEDNTPAILHTRLVPGDKLTLTCEVTKERMGIVFVNAVATVDDEVAVSGELMFALDEA